MTLHGYLTLVQRSGNTNKREAVLVVVHRAIVPALSGKRSWAPTGTYQASYQPKLPVVRAGIVRDRPCQWELGRSVGGAISALPPSRLWRALPARASTTAARGCAQLNLSVACYAASHCLGRSVVARCKCVIPPKFSQVCTTIVNKLKQFPQATLGSRLASKDLWPNKAKFSSLPVSRPIILFFFRLPLTSDRVLY